MTVQQGNGNLSDKTNLMVIFYILFFSATMFNGSIMVALRKSLRNE